jgi:hypothetical protein
VGIKGYAIHPQSECNARLNCNLKNCDDAKENTISVWIDLIHLEHNHEFIKKDTEKNHLQCSKTHDLEYMEFLSAMQESRISQHCIMDFVSKMHGGL